MPGTDERMFALTRTQWELLVRLPGQVVIAATSAESDGARCTIAEGIAGIDAIAAGRSSDSELVRRVVATIYAERDEDAPVAEEFADPAAGFAHVLDSAREAAAVLRGCGAPADRDAYRSWVYSIAERVCGAARSGGVLGFGGVPVSPAEQDFLTDLAEALGG
jgi:hypothetical protein